MSTDNLGWDGWRETINAEPVADARWGVGAARGPESKEEIQSGSRGLPSTYPCTYPITPILSWFPHTCTRDTSTLESCYGKTAKTCVRMGTWLGRRHTTLSRVTNCQLQAAWFLLVGTRFRESITPEVIVTGHCSSVLKHIY